MIRGQTELSQTRKAIVGTNRQIRKIRANRSLVCRFCNAVFVSAFCWTCRDPLTLRTCGSWNSEPTGSILFSRSLIVGTLSYSSRPGTGSGCFSPIFARTPASRSRPTRSPASEFAKSRIRKSVPPASLIPMTSGAKSQRR